MKIALACSTFPPDGANGGTATFYSELARALASLGHDVLVVTLTNEKACSEIVDGVRVERIFFDESQYQNLQLLGFVPFTAWYMSRAVHLYKHSIALLKEFEPDILECHEHGFLGLLLQSKDYPMVVRCLCPAFQSMALNGDDKRFPVDTNLTAALEIAFLQRADALTCPSSSLAGVISEKTGIPQKRFEIIRNPLTRDEAVACAANERNFPRLTFIGRVEHLKGCDLLVEIMPDVLKSFPDATLTFIGEEGKSPGMENSFSQQLRLRARESGCADRLTFAGLIPRNQLATSVRDADIAIFPSRYDSSPYACLEAMSLAMPVVASNVGGIPEYVENGITGMLFESENVASLANAVVALCKDAELRDKIAKSAQESVASMCNPRAVAMKTQELYEITLQEFKNGSQRANKTNLLDDRVIGALLSAFDDLVETPYYRERLDSELKSHMEEVYQSGVRAGFRAGRRSIASNPAGAMIDGIKFLARSYKRKL